MFVAGMIIGCANFTSSTRVSPTVMPRVAAPSKMPAVLASDGMPALDTGLDQVRGVWVYEETGGIFLATHRGSQVWYVDTAGIIHLFLDGRSGVHAGDGEPFDAPGPKVSEIRNVTMDRKGNILVTENDFGFGWLPRISGDHSHFGYWLDMADNTGKLEGLFRGRLRFDGSALLEREMSAIRQNAHD